MNGQSYDTVVPKSMNGTTPTPSSNSYPGKYIFHHLTTLFFFISLIMVL